MMKTNIENNNLPNDMQTKTAETYLVKKTKIIIGLLALILIFESLGAIFFLKKYSAKIPPPVTNETKIKETIASITLIPKEKQVKTGDTFTIEVKLNTNNREINGADAVIKYNPLFLEAAEKIENGDLFDNLLIAHVDKNKGIIDITASRLSNEQKTISGEGVLALVTFVAKQKGETTVDLIFDEARSDTSNVLETKTSKNILTTVSGSLITITE